LEKLKHFLQTKLEVDQIDQGRALGGLGVLGACKLLEALKVAPKTLFVGVADKKRGDQPQVVGRDGHVAGVENVAVVCEVDPDREPVQDRQLRQNVARDDVMGRGHVVNHALVGAPASVWGRHKPQVTLQEHAALDEDLVSAAQAVMQEA
jgi:hypothetical protein